MAPPNLQGLNIVHPTQPHNPSISDSQDLLSAPPFPDLSAQLDLWTNLAFESDEPLIRRDDQKYLNRKKLPSKADDEEEEYTSREGAAPHESHQNVVTGTSLPLLHTNDSTASHVPQPGFDLNQFLAGIGLDPYALPSGQPSLPAGVPSLAQLLSLHQQGSIGFPSVAPPALPHINTQQRFEQDSSIQPPAKRVRSRKTSISTVDSPETPYDISFDGDASTSTPVTPAEDKRRRNTAASARFRMKKKEREAALEQKAKELEGRVNELERECEGLRRENGWLKGLVVGVTGGQPPATGKKRSREEVEAASVATGAR